jgi:hypothetical protein
MAQATWTEAETAEAKRIWAEYQETHDVSALAGQTAGIDPKRGRIWFGVSATEAAKKMRGDGVNCPLFFIRIGREHYLRKGRSR